MLFEMNANELKCPLLLLRKNGTFGIIKRREWLETVFEPLVKSGYYSDGELVDREGRVYRVVSIQKIRGAGAFWGYSLFRPRKIHVEMKFERIKEHKFELDELKRILLADFTEFSPWASREDFDELRRSIEAAQSVGNLIELLGTSV
jgi:hypothetical protein